MAQIIKKGRKFLNAGRWIVVFPEGTRTAPGHVGKYHMGGARLAVETGYPILLLRITQGTFGRAESFSKCQVHSRCHWPWIETKDRKPDELLALTKDWIEETMLRINKNNYATCFCLYRYFPFADCSVIFYALRKRV